MASRTYRVVSHEFSPAEVAKATGVSVELQRDWKRRGYLAHQDGGRHSRYRFEDMCRMMALKAFSDAGVRLQVATATAGSDDLSSADTAASLAMLPMLGFANYPVGTTHAAHRIGRFVIVESSQLFRVDSLEEYQRNREERQAAGPVAIIFDCKRAAEAILSKLHRPHMTIEEVEE